MSQSALIYGAGALGRAFLAPLLHAHGMRVSFVDVNPALIRALRARRAYTAARALPDGYDLTEIPVEHAYVLGEEEDALARHELVLTCVGVRNYLSLWRPLAHAYAVISCENERASAVKLKEAAQNEYVYFGIADVIASSTAPLTLRQIDPLAVVSEDGLLLVERADRGFPAFIRQLPEHEFSQQWACKLYLHNAPHAIAAYLGWQMGCVHIHEAMQIQSIAHAVTGAMLELVATVVHAGLVDRGLAERYSRKELGRFQNSQLCDPISRVARDPMRKLAPGERLVGAAQLALGAGITPINICRGIRAGLEYHIASGASFGRFSSRNELLTSALLCEVTGITEGTLFELIVKHGDARLRFRQSPVA